MNIKFNSDMLSTEHTVFICVYMYIYIYMNMQLWVYYLPTYESHWFFGTCIMPVYVRSSYTYLIQCAKFWTLRLIPVEGRSTKFWRRQGDRVFLKMDSKVSVETPLASGYWIHLARDSDKWRVSLDTINKTADSKNYEKTPWQTEKLLAFKKDFTIRIYWLLTCAKVHRSFFLYINKLHVHGSVHHHW
jgi:hypothetical protein